VAAENKRDIAKQGGLRGMGIPATFSVAIHVGIAVAAVWVGANTQEQAPSEPIEFMIVSLAPPAPAGGGGGAVEEAAPAPLPPAPQPQQKARPKVAKAPKAKPAGLPVASKEKAPEEPVAEPVEESVEVAAVEPEAAEAAADAADELADAVGGQVLLAMAGGTGSGMGFGIGVGHGTGTGAGQGFGFGDGAPVDVKNARTQPRVLSEMRDNYPMAARRRGIEGVVVVRLVLDKRGRVEREFSKVVKSIPALDKAAIEAANQLRFSPALDGAGNPMRVIVEMPIRYRLND